MSTFPEKLSVIVGDLVRSFDPRTLGVIRYGRVVETFGSCVEIDFGLHGSTIVAVEDIVEVL